MRQKPLCCNTCVEGCCPNQAALVISAYKKANGDVIVNMIENGGKFFVPTRAICNLGDSYYCVGSVKNPYPDVIYSEQKEIPVFSMIGIPQAELAGCWKPYKEMEYFIPTPLRKMLKEELKNYDIVQKNLQVTN